MFAPRKIRVFSLLSLLVLVSPLAAARSKVATPTFSPAAGTYTSTQSVTINDSTSGATIYYTTNGSTPTSSSTEYSAPISVSSTQTIKAIAEKSGYSNSSVASAKYTITLAAATPTFSPVAGSYSTVQSVVISDATTGATLYYTTDGTTPTTGSTRYTSPVTVNTTETINAIATASGYSTSAVGSATYTITTPATPTPTLSPSTGTYPWSPYGEAVAIAIGDSNQNATIYYTTDGTTPTTDSDEYSDPVAINSNATVKAIATAPGYLDSAVATGAYTVLADPPYFSEDPGSYVGSQSITLEDDTSSRAKIYYTTNGTTPTTSSPLYSGSITVASTETIEAIAVVSGYATSPVSSGTFTITSVPEAPTFSPSPGSYSTAPLVNINENSLNATVYYTVTPGTSGVTPTTSSPNYTGTLTVGSTQTIEAIAAVSGFTSSNVTIATYTLPSPLATTTTLTITSDGNPVASIDYGAAVVLNASVSTNGQALTAGTVEFCSEAASSCTDVNLLGSAQLSPAGTAALTLKPGVGTHNFSAIFVETSTSQPSSSPPAQLTVSGSDQTITSLTQAAPNQKLVATVMGAGDVPEIPTGSVSILDANNNNAFLTGGPLVPQSTVTSMGSPQSAALPGVPSESHNFLTEGDFNGDGNPDIAIFTSNGSLSILLGNGNGTFSQAPASPITDVYGTAIATGDFNGDGKLDIALADGYTITVLLGNGDGTFNPESDSYLSCMSPTSLAVGDINKDGKLDMVVGCSDTGGLPLESGLLILEGNGDGTFTEASGSPFVLTSDDSPTSVVLGDFNGDGNYDIAAVQEHGNISVLLGNGDGTFTQASGSPFNNNGYELEDIVAGDFNHDGRVDLAIADYYYSRVDLFLGNGDGTFNAVGSISGGGAGAWSLAIGDFNLDGIPDLVVAYDPDIMGSCQPQSSCPYPTTIQYLIGSGNGSFSPGPLQSVSGGPQEIAVADFTSDGVPDITSANWGDGVGPTTLNVYPVYLGYSGTVVFSSIPENTGGTDVISASYAGDDNYQASTSSTLPVALPWISGITPATGGPGAFVKVEGANFGTPSGTVTINGSSMEVGSWTPSEIEAVVASGATTGSLVVTNGMASNSVPFTVPSSPTISSVSPAFGATGNSITISGYNFGTAGEVSFNGVSATVTSWGMDTIICTVPSGTTTGPVIVTVGSTASNGYNFTVASSILGISPSQGSVGTQVTITGSGFGSAQGTSVVTFNGIPATPSSWSDTSIVVNAPNGVSTGKIAVQEGGMVTTGPLFTVAPAISALLPASGPAGTLVTISGSNFGVSQGTSSVTFGQLSSTPSQWSSNRIVVAVPSSAVTGSVVVTVSGQASNPLQFTVGTSTSTGTISGTVTQTDGVTPVTAATVRVMTGNTATATTTTNSSGSYSIPNLSAATYNVEATAYGYTAGVQSNVTLGSGQSSIVNFSLASQSSITYTYDALNRLIGVISPALGAAGYSYDGVGNLISIGRAPVGQVAIFGFTPNSGTVGTAVTISGAAFSSDPQQDTVTFAGTTATITSATATQLVVTVPSGVATGPIAVTTPGGTATSTASFTVNSSSLLVVPPMPQFLPPMSVDGGRQIAAQEKSRPSQPSANFRDAIQNGPALAPIRGSIRTNSHPSEGAVAAVRVTIRNSLRLQVPNEAGIPLRLGTVILGNLAQSFFQVEKAAAKVKVIGSLLAQDQGV